MDDFVPPQDNQHPTGALPAVSFEGNQYYFIAYDYNTNYIYASPVQNLKGETLINTFDTIFQDFTAYRHKPLFNVTDNQATTPCKAYLQQHDCTWQFVEPSNHQVNVAERAIQSFKNHFISDLCSTNTKWSIQLWDQLTEQALITLNLCQIEHAYPTKSAYHAMHGHKYNWNRCPMAPPGTIAVVYKDPTRQCSWAPRGVDAWYCGPAFDH